MRNDKSIKNVTSSKSPLVTDEGVDVRLIALIIGIMATLILTWGAFATDVLWQHYFFGFLATIMSFVTGYAAGKIYRRK